MRLILLTIALVLTSTIANAQTRAPKIIDSSSVTIVTKVPFNGLNYFITIVPIDTANIDNMPMYDLKFRRSEVHIWRDSLQLMLPDSILKLLPKREDFLRPRRPSR